VTRGGVWGVRVQVRC